MNNEEQQSGLVPTNATAERFYSGAERRIFVFMLALTALAGVAVVVFSPGAGVGFMCGATLSAVNLKWIGRGAAKATSALAETASSGRGAGLSGMSMAFGTVLRLALVTGAGYVIFRHSVVGFYGYIGGIGISVLAMLVEAIYEAWTAVSRGL